MMLIDIEPILDAAKLAGKEYVSIDFLKGFEQVDAVPVVRGEWIEPGENDITTACICSVCDWKGHIMEDDVLGMPYCPNCGAKMGGEL